MQKKSYFCGLGQVISAAKVLLHGPNDALY